MSTTLTPDDDALLAQFRAATVAWSVAVDATADGDLARKRLRHEIAESLLGGTNAATGKPHSWSSACEAAELADLYREAVHACAERARDERLADLERSVVAYTVQLHLRRLGP